MSADTSTGPGCDDDNPYNDPMLLDDSAYALQSRNEKKSPSGEWTCGNQSNECASDHVFRDRTVSAQYSLEKHRGAVDKLKD